MVYEMNLDIDDNRMIIEADGRLELALPHVSHSYMDRRTQEKTFDTVDDLMAFVVKQRNYYAASMYSYWLPRAYEIVNDHYIRLFYLIHTSNA